MKKFMTIGVTVNQNNTFFLCGKYVNLSTSSVIFSIVVTAIFCSDLCLNVCVTKERRSRSVCCW